MNKEQRIKVRKDGGAELNFNHPDVANRFLRQLKSFDNSQLKQLVKKIKSIYIKVNNLFMIDLLSNINYNTSTFKTTTIKRS